MYKAVIFDNDGVLMNPLKMFSEVFSEKYLISLENVTPFFVGPLQDCIVSKKDLKEELVPWLQKWNYLGSVEDFLDEWFNSENYVDSTLVQRIKDLRRRGVKCYLATNQEKYRVEWMKKHLEFNELFDFVFSSSLLGVKKKDKKFFEMVLSKTGLNENEVLYLDDEEENIESAKTLGMKGFLYKGIEDLDKVENLLNQ